MSTPIDLDRPLPRGGSATLLRLEAKRVIRNRRTMIFTVVMPVMFFVMFGTNSSYAPLPYGNGNVGASIMIGMALYGALAATTGVGAAVSTERATGWSRQLRLTPLNPVAYILAKSVAGLIVGLVAMLAVYACGAATSAHMTLGAWVLSGLVVWSGSLVFVAFGLLMGYLLPTDNAMQVVGPLMALLAFLGGMFMPIDPGSTLDQVARLTPMYGLHKLALAPLGAGDFTWVAVVNVLAWLAIFGGGAAWRMSRDTARV